MSSRAAWKGILQVARVRVPIKLYATTDEPAGISFNQLHTVCSTRVTQPRICATCETPVESDAISKGYEYEPGRFVVVLPEELEALQPASASVIDLQQIADVDALELRSIARAYFVVPDGIVGSPAVQAYVVLATALRGKVAIGKIAIYGRETLIAVSPETRAPQSALLLYTLHAAAEERAIAWPGRDVAARAGRLELSLAQAVLETLATPALDLTLVDELQAGVRRLIDAKIAGEEIVSPPPPPVPAPLPLIEALTLSVAVGRKQQAKPVRRRA